MCTPKPTSETIIKVVEKDIKQSTMIDEEVMGGKDIYVTYIVSGAFFIGHKVKVWLS